MSGCSYIGSIIRSLHHKVLRPSIIAWKAYSCDVGLFNAGLGVLVSTSTSLAVQSLIEGDRLVPDRLRPVARWDKSSPSRSAFADACLLRRL